VTGAIRWPLTIVGAVLLSSTALTLLQAQSGTTGGLAAVVDVGASRIHYDGYLPSGVLDLAPSIRLDAPNAVLVARGSLARFESGNINSQGALMGGLFSPARGIFRGEIASSGSLGYHQSIGSTGLIQVNGRLHAVMPGGGFWAGAGLGWSALGGGLGAGMTTFELGGWLRRAVGGDGSLRATGLVRATEVGAVRYSEASAAIRWTAARAELGLDGGVRSGDRALGSGAERGWLSADAALWVMPRLAVVAAAGNFLADPTTSAIGGGYASVGLRWALRRPARDELPRVLLPRNLGRTEGWQDATVPAPGGAPTPSSNAESLLVEEGGEGRVTLRFTLPGANSAQVMGDFTDWLPVSLERDAAGRWAVTLALPAGVHRVNLRTDDGPWRSPPGLTAVDDGFGGKVGLLVVRR